MNFFFTTYKQRFFSLNESASAALAAGNECLTSTVVCTVTCALKLFKKLLKIEQFIDNIELNLTSESFDEIIHSVFRKTMNFMQILIQGSVDSSKVDSMIAQDAKNALKLNGNHK